MEWSWLEWHDYFVFHIISLRWLLQHLLACGHLVVEKMLILWVHVSGSGGSAGNKFRMSLGLPVAAVVNCATTLGPRIFTSYRWKESRVASTDCHMLVLVTWSWLLWKRGSPILGRRYCQQLLWDSVTRGEERMVPTCTLKVILSLNMLILLEKNMLAF